MKEGTTLLAAQICLPCKRSRIRVKRIGLRYACRIRKKADILRIEFSNVGLHEEMDEGALA